MVRPSLSREAHIVAGFPGVGKSRVTREGKALGMGRAVMDLDSSSFSWGQDGLRNPHFVRDYVDAIVEKAREPGIVLVSTHAEVREELVRRGVDFTLVCPSKDLKDEYIQRMKSRGTLALAELFHREWDELVQSCIDQRDCQHYVLKSGRYLEVDDLVWFCSGVEEPGIYELQDGKYIREAE
jgi:hypothetical protein